MARAPSPATPAGMESGTFWFMPIQLMPMLMMRTTPPRQTWKWILSTTQFFGKLDRSLPTPLILRFNGLALQP